MKRVIAALLVIMLCLLCACSPKEEELPQEESSAAEGSVSVPPVQRGDLVATAYPEGVKEEAVGGILGSLSNFMDVMLKDDFSTSSLLSIACENKILRLYITETAWEACEVSGENVQLYEGNLNPFRTARQNVVYAANSGHTINNLSIVDEMASVGVKDFFTCLASAAAVNDDNGNLIRYDLTEADAAEIISYCSAMLAENKDTELYILSDNEIAFAMCERYSENSLLGFIGFFEKTEGDVYKIKTLIDFNC